MLPSDLLPRVLNTQDIPSIRPSDPQPIFAPEEDFDRNGSTDIAISGVYALKKESKRYFVLVAASQPNGRFKRLFLEDYDSPVFLHGPATTGDADPGDQAFSASFCMDCSQGFDFYWNKKSGRFHQVAWKEKTQRLQKVVKTPAEDVPPEEADKALKVAGELKDVMGFTSEMKKKGRAFGVRVEYPEERVPHQYRVRIYEKKKSGGEKLYDVITVDTARMSVVKRGIGK